MTVSENLEVWTTPQDYSGFNPVGDYLVYSINRDSSILENLNFEIIKEQIGEGNYYTFSASHWACGWVEYLLIEKDVDYGVIKIAEGLICALSDYPVLSDERYSEKQLEEIQKYWSSCSISAKIDYCKDAEISIFAAREEYCPMRVEDTLRDSESFY